MKNFIALISLGMGALGLTACGTQNASQQTGGYYNSAGQWVSNTGGVVAGNACITTAQQSLSLNFSASNVTFNGNSGFYAGQLPNTHPMSGAHGSVSLNGGMQNVGTTMIQKQSQSGQLQIYINPQSRTASGMIQINAQALYQTGIMNYLYSGYNQQSLCVTSVAMDVIYSASINYNGQTSTGYINSALVYLYLSNGQVLQTPVQFY